MTHTPTPWTIEPGHSVLKIHGEGREVAVTVGTPYWQGFSAVEQANAEFIVRAANAHDAMLAALVACHSLIASEFGSAEASALEGHPIDKAARATWDAVCEAIALAEGKP